MDLLTGMRTFDLDPLDAAATKRGKNIFVRVVRSFI